MALTPLQRDVCWLLADNRIRSGESYVAGAAALNELLKAPRRSRDIDLFHETEHALATSWKADRGSLEEHGYALSILRERPIFPLVRHGELGLTLHPFDLATNKILEAKPEGRQGGGASRGPSGC